MAARHFSMPPGHAAEGISGHFAGFHAAVFRLRWPLRYAIAADATLYYFG